MYKLIIVVMETKSTLFAVLHAIETKIGAWTLRGQKIIVQR